VNGAFSSKWSMVPEKCGLASKSMNYDWGLGVKSEDIDRILKTGKFDVFAMVHNETSTGAKSNLEEISDMLKTKYPDVIWLVDAVSSMAGIKIEVDKLGIDFIFSSTQKAWGIPAGFSILSVSDRFIEKSKEIINLILNKHHGIQHMKSKIKTYVIGALMLQRTWKSIINKTISKTNYTQDKLEKEIDYLLWHFGSKLR
jgi:aspartate aminotransferase-like enzyme